MNDLITYDQLVAPFTVTVKFVPLDHTAEVRTADLIDSVAHRLSEHLTLTDGERVTLYSIEFSGHEIGFD